MTTARTPTPLRDVLYAFSLAKPIPDADLLEEFTRRYPEHAPALTEFAIELAVDVLRADEAEADVAGGSVSSAVSRAMSAFQNRLFEVRKTSPVVSSPPILPRSAAPNPFAALDRARFRKVAEQMNANVVFVAKLRDRLIDPQTMTQGFRLCAAQALSVPLEVMNAHLAEPPLLAAQSYKADQKPEVGRKQSFSEAVQSSGLTETQQQYLLKL